MCLRKQRHKQIGTDLLRAGLKNVHLFHICKLSSPLMPLVLIQIPMLCYLQRKIITHLSFTKNLICRTKRPLLKNSLRE